MIAASYPFLDVVWTMLIFFAWVIWFWLLITVFGDIFRRQDLSGWGKTGWTVFVIVLPFLGVFIYLISQSKGMTERNIAQQQQVKSEADSYIRSVAQSDPADQIAKAKDLLDSGAISQSEYDSIKQKALATA